MATADRTPDTPLSPETDVMQEANQLGHRVLDDLVGETSETLTRFEGGALNPAVLASARCLVFLRTTRGGLIIGGARGSGFAIALAPGGAWSPPCFVNLTRWALGGIMGVESSSTLMAAVSRAGQAELVEGSAAQFGTNISVQLPFIAGSGPDDEIALGAGAGWAVASVGAGALLDFSLGGGALRVDKAKNVAAYGEAGADAAGILAGKVPHQAALVPLYKRVREIAAAVRK